METPKVNCSDATLRAAKQIAGMQGKKNKIDTYYEYEQLGKLLADVQQGKLDKNLIENDVLYIKGLQLEYQQTYLGEEGRGQSSDTPAPKTTETQKETNGHAEPAKAEAQKEKPAAPVTPPASTPPTKADIPAKSEPKNPPKAKAGKPQKSSTENINKGNNHADNGSVVVSGDNNDIFPGAVKAGAVVPGKADKSTGADDSANTAKNDETMINKSKQNYTAAFAEGKQVAKDLIGYTTTEEKQNAIRYIMKQSPDTIMGFINGFNENDSVLGVPYGKGGLLDQVDNEYGWTNSEKNEVFTKVISTTLNWAKAVGFGNDPNYQSLESILKQLSTKGQIDTERADLLIKELITKGMAKAGI